MQSPTVSFLGRCIISQPWVWLGVPVQAVPMKIVLRQVEFLLFCRQDISYDQAIEFPIRKVIGVVEYDVIVVELVQRIPKQIVQFLICKVIWIWQFKLRFKPGTQGQERSPFPGEH